MEKKNKIFYDFHKMILFITSLFQSIFCFFLYKINIIPSKYFIILTSILFVLLVMYSLLILKNTKKWIYIIADVLLFLIMCVQLYFIYIIINTYRSLSVNFGIEHQTNIYNVVVRHDSNINSIQDIQGKKIYWVKNIDNESLIKNALKEKTDVTLVPEQNIYKLFNKVLLDENTVILVNSGNYDAMIDIDDTYESKLKIIDTIEVKIKVNNPSKDINLTKDPFVVYISGIDTRYNTMPSNSLSDVNIIMAVNPNTHRILLIHIPRDYYIQVYGTTGLKDKLTHAGIIGGISSSMDTIENFLDIDIPYYVRMNFNAVQNIVNEIGGITVYSDVSYTIRCHTDHYCLIRPGYNNYKGRCALAFARERKGYATGDRHRGENQEQVIASIINKLSSSKMLLSNFDGIVDAVSGSFETNVTMEQITSLVKFQLNDMKSWNIETYNLDGTGFMKPTYSYPEKNLYVMQPNMDTVHTAMNKLNEVLEK